MVRKYVPPKVSYEKVTSRKSKTIPDQSMSLQEIMRRYVRGIPMDVVHRDPVYSDTGRDLEAINRMDFADKAALADEIKAENQAIRDAFASEELRRKSEQEEREREKAKSSASTGMDQLDNNMPVDTEPVRQQVRRGKKSSSDE